MRNTVSIIVVCMCLASLATASEKGSIEIDYHLNSGSMASRELSFKGTACTIQKEGGEKTIELSEEKMKAILAAIQAEAKRFVVAPRKFSSLKMDTTTVSGEHIGLQFKYKAAGAELEIELDIPFGAPSGLSKEMVAIIKTYFGLDLSKPKRPKG